MRTGAILVTAECANTVMHGGRAGVTIAAVLVTGAVNVLLVATRRPNRHNIIVHLHSILFSSNLLDAFFQSRFV